MLIIFIKTFCTKELVQIISHDATKALNSDGKWVDWSEKDPSLDFKVEYVLNNGDAFTKFKNANNKFLGEDSSKPDDKGTEFFFLPYGDIGILMNGNKCMKIHADFYKLSPCDPLKSNEIDKDLFIHFFIKPDTDEEKGYDTAIKEKKESIDLLKEKNKNANGKKILILDKNELGNSNPSKTSKESETTTQESSNRNNLKEITNNNQAINLFNKVFLSDSNNQESNFKKNNLLTSNEQINSDTEKRKKLNLEEDLEALKEKLKEFIKQKKSSLRNKLKKIKSKSKEFKDKKLEVLSLSKEKLKNAKKSSQEELTNLVGNLKNSYNKKLESLQENIDKKYNELKNNLKKKETNEMSHTEIKSNETYKKSSHGHESPILNA
ncbi:hypothetical protein TUBRATIS_005080 [Tubulinosema ratisbonensis]|uniref:Uncharacterized protein n=1 Tax=Tubulinosema ratisbonensis TaxID=291195 RepID=A0A437APQ6_9MICR|nr:hypothetical protein TUBRATIS_005080 [Tubulinosema ratisbonensis]